jgi:glucose-6-phosphate 1-dehydrogenase
MFAKVAEQLASMKNSGQARVILEKPFGRDPDVTQKAARLEVAGALRNPVRLIALRQLVYRIGQERR